MQWTLLFAALDSNTVALDITDAFFDRSWLGEVELIERLRPSELWGGFFNKSVPIKTSLPELLKIRSLWTDEYLIQRYENITVQSEPEKRIVPLIIAEWKD